MSKLDYYCAVKPIGWNNARKLGTIKDTDEIKMKASCLKQCYCKGKPAVSVEEHKLKIKQWQDNCDFWINKVRYFESCLQKDKFTTINGIQFEKVKK